MLISSPSTIKPKISYEELWDETEALREAAPALIGQESYQDSDIQKALLESLKHGKDL